MPIVSAGLRRLYHPIRSYLSSVPTINTVHHRPLSTTPVRYLKKFVEQVDGDTTIVQVVDVESDRAHKVPMAMRNDECCCLCKLGVKISFQDVLILEQFMRADGTVLPKTMTGLCKKQQLRVERCVMQAHWSGLFPNRTLPGVGIDRTGYKQFNRHWNDDMDMYRLRHRVEVGTWFYIKRYDVGTARPYAVKPNEPISLRSK